MSKINPKIIIENSEYLMKNSDIRERVEKSRKSLDSLYESDSGFKKNCDTLCSYIIGDVRGE